MGAKSMGLKEDLLTFLDEETSNLNVDNPSVRLTAKGISDIFQVKRNTVSHYLNQLADEELVIKINTRPVYFLNRMAYERQFYPLSSCHFHSFYQLLEQQPTPITPLDIFQKLIGADGSLKRVIDQIKTSIYYPDGGLPMILSGPTGVGKSYTAELIYRYSIEKGILPKDAPFVSFNCAQYANNPELMSSNLFGYVKGAFTGAEKTKEGILAAADGGILFLDEVHRLNAEGQEKLFTFLDQGVYRRMGESQGSHQANVRLIFATTENLEEHFLQTFLRRIPIRVVIPGLEERGEIEKRKFMYLFFIHESRKLGIPIRITNRALEALTSHRYDGNMGELKNTIKYISASCYVKNRDAQEIHITLQDLPEKILEDSIQFKTNKFQPNHRLIIYPDSTLDDLYETNLSQIQLIKNTYELIVELFDDSQSKGFDQKYFEENVFNHIRLLFDRLIFKNPKENAGVMLELTTVKVQEIIQYLESNFSVSFNGNSIYAFTHFLYYKGNSVINWADKQTTLIHQLTHYMDTSYKMEQQLAIQFAHLLESKLDIKLYPMDVNFLSFYLRSLAIERSNQQVKSIILAHGYATASSIANVANRLLRKNVIEAFDMPIDITGDEITSRVLNYIQHNNVSKGLIILVDMGSLKDIYSQIKHHVDAPVAIINNVTTQMALFLGSMLDKDLFLEEMIEKLQEANQTEYRIIYPERKKEKVIITSCLTGMGTSYQIQKLLEASIPEDLNIKVMAYEYNRLKELGTSESIFQIYDVLAIVGTADPGLEQIHYLSLEDIISGQGEKKLRKIFHTIGDAARLKEINDNLIRHFSLERVIESITILDSEKILTHVEDFINRLELRLNKRLSNDKKVALYVHMSCLVERLIRQAPIETYPNLEEFQQCQKEMILLLKDAFSVIENIYCVKINIAEIGYIFDYLTAKSSYDGDY
jgi:sigma-54 dependent transcriptional regulator, gfr operon transcriptional activator